MFLTFKTKQDSLHHCGINYDPVAFKKRAKWICVITFHECRQIDYEKIDASKVYLLRRGATNGTRAGVTCSC